MSVSAELVQRLWPGETMPVTPVGTLKEKGWSPGTYVYYVDESVNPNFELTPGTVAMVDIWTSREGAAGSKPNRPAGFFQHGSQKVNGDDLVAEETYKWTGQEPGNFLEFDINKTLRYKGSAITTMVVGSTGFFKTYVFEKKDSGDSPLTYGTSDVLYVSDKAIWTKEVFTSGVTTGHISGYQVARTGTDEGGDYLIIANNY